MAHTQPKLAQITMSSQWVHDENSPLSAFSFSNVAGDTLRTLLDLPEVDLRKEEIGAQNLLRAMHDFVENPAKTKSDFLAICKMLKASSNADFAYNLGQ